MDSIKNQQQDMNLKMKDVFNFFHLSEYTSIGTYFVKRPRQESKSLLT